MHLTTKKKYILSTFICCFLFGFIYFYNSKEISKENNKKENLVKAEKKAIKAIEKDEDLPKKEKTLLKKENKKISKNVNPYIKGLESLRNKNLKALLISIKNSDYEDFIKLYKKHKNITNQFFFMAVPSFIKDKRIMDILYNDYKDRLLKNIDQAVGQSNFEFLSYLIDEKGINIDGEENSFSLKMMALRSNNKEALTWIEQKGGIYNDYDYKNITSLVSSSNLSIEEMQRYTDEGFDFNDEFYSEKLLELSFFENNIELAQYLYDKANIINKKAVTPNGERNAILAAVFFSANKENLEQIKWYEQHGYDIYARDNQGNGILDLAIKSKREDIIIYYLEEGFTFKENEEKISSYDDLYNEAKKNKLLKVIKYME